MAISALTIILDEDLKDEAAERIISACAQLKGVASVLPGEADKLGELTARVRLRAHLLPKLVELFSEEV